MSVEVRFDVETTVEEECPVGCEERHVRSREYGEVLERTLVVVMKER